jgi:hypothetical protein
LIGIIINFKAMIIHRMQKAIDIGPLSGLPDVYASGPVFTTIDGKKTWVSDGYAASSIAAICKRAFGNADIRQKVALFRGQTSM